MGWYFVFFLISGFCSLLYELIWLRLSMAQFGVTTAQVSIVLSTFMAGLGFGSWVGGVLARRYGDRINIPTLRFYALLEFLIGISSVTVPVQLQFGHRVLASLSGQTAYSSGAYYLASGLIVSAILVPWCACMGATIPIAMHAIRRALPNASSRSFSFLYLSNVVGALAGAIIPLFLIEERGFHNTLRVGMMLNFTIAAGAFLLSFRRRAQAAMPTETVIAENGIGSRGKSPLVLLFLTGLVTMGIEVVWTRLFTPYIGPLVYSFALILACYLFATFVGSVMYRTTRYFDPANTQISWITLAFASLLALLASDPRIDLGPMARVPIGVAPFSILVGFLTPMLVDRWSGGNAQRAGTAYAVNVVGCIVGPLVAGFVLLPLVGEHMSMLLFAVPWMLMLIPHLRLGKAQWKVAATGSVMVIASLALFFLTRDFETTFPSRVVLRDSTATVIATGAGMDRRLVTNGIGMTSLTPITKMMAHLTLASLPNAPRNALVICFGMGTTFRSVISWGIPATAVELVPSVPRMFTYFHEDGDQVMDSPLAHVVIDDGRRFLERTPEKFDAIIIDPPPPVTTAASSLLYSEDFYALAKQHLQPGGILAQWLPNGDQAVQSSVAQALTDSFPYVRTYRSYPQAWVFQSQKGLWGWHFLASMSPLPDRTTEQLVQRMPAKAVADMMEWGPEKTPENQFQRILSNEMSADQMIALSPNTPPMQDDRPVNEYFLLRFFAEDKPRTENNKGPAIVSRRSRPGSAGISQ